MFFCPRCLRSYDEGAVRFCENDGAALTTGSRFDVIRARPTRQIGAILDGRYAVKGFVGKGGVARVYLAEDTRTRLPVAVKIMSREAARIPVMRERFLQEIEVAAAIGHPNVVQVLDAGERPDGSPFIVLEFLHGESLGDHLRREAVADPALIVPMMARAASALVAAHRAGIIHRDIKPDNLFLVGEVGAPYSLKVVDFGMAKVKTGVELSQAGITVGTLAYMAPEQALADPVDARTDVYGLGVVLYRALTGALPFDTNDDARLVASHLFVPPRPPTALRPGLDPRLGGVILHALRKRPENRYPTMEAMLHDLERILGEREGEVEPLPIRAAPDHYQGVSVTAKGAAEVLRKLVQI